MDHWIRIRDNLGTNPKVLRMADMLVEAEASRQLLLPGLGGENVTLSNAYRMVHRNVVRDVCICALLRVWSAGNSHTLRGVFKNVTLQFIDDVTQIPGFGRIMASVGWVIEDTKNKCLRLPNFLKHNTPAKLRVEGDDDAQPRSGNAIRQARHRAKQQKSNATSNADRNAMSNGTSNSAVTPQITDRIRGREENVTHSHNGRVTAPPLRLERPDGWPETEAAAASVAGTVGINPDLAVTYWNHHEGIQQWPAGSFASFIKAKAGFKGQDLADKLVIEKERQKLRATDKSNAAVTTTTSKAGTDGW